MEASKSQFALIMKAVGVLRLEDGPALRTQLALEDVRAAPATPAMDDSNDSSDTGFWKEVNGIKPKCSPNKKNCQAHLSDSDDQKPCSNLLKGPPSDADTDDDKALTNLVHCPIEVTHCPIDVDSTPMPKSKKSPGKVICVSINLDSCNLKTKMYLNLVHGCVYSMHSNFTHM